MKQGNVSDSPVGRYTYNKRKRTGLAVPVETLAYSVNVREISDTYPEVSERTRT